MLLPKRCTWIDLSKIGYFETLGNLSAITKGQDSDQLKSSGNVTLIFFSTKTKFYNNIHTDEYFRLNQ
jgi:uncharacterized protein with NRDE domain